MTMKYATFIDKLYVAHPSLPLLISEDGDILYNDEKRKPIPCKGYAQICVKVCRKWKHYYVHRLVAETFIPNPEHKPTVDHINQNRTDNRVDNLRWATYTEQMHNKSKKGSSGYKQFSHKYNPTYTQRYYAKNRDKLLQYYKDYYQAHKEELREYYRKRHKTYRNSSK